MSTLQHRLFFAILPPPGPRGVIAHISEDLDPAARHVAGDRLHITLSITPDFAEYPEAVADRLRGVGEAIVAAPVAIALDQISGSARSVVLRPSHVLRPLDRLEGEIARRALARGVPLRRRRFAPHVTMHYRNGRPFTRRTDPVGWRAREVVLIHSAVGATRHHVIGRWPLAGRDSGAAQLDLFD